MHYHDYYHQRRLFLIMLHVILNFLVLSIIIGFLSSSLFHSSGSKDVLSDAIFSEIVKPAFIISFLNFLVETENLASKYKGNFINDSFAYQFISARIYINNLDTRKFVENYIYIPEEIIESPSKAVDFYAYGLALIKEKKYKKR